MWYFSGSQFCISLRLPCRGFLLHRVIDLNVSFSPLSSNRERPHLPRTSSPSRQKPRELMKGCCLLFSFSLKRGGTWLQYTFDHRFTVPAPGRLPALAPLTAAGGRLPPPPRFPRATLGPRGQRDRRNSHGPCGGGFGLPFCRHRPRSCADAKRGFLVGFLPAVTNINRAHFPLPVCGRLATRNTSIEDKSFLQNYLY